MNALSAGADLPVIIGGGLAGLMTALHVAPQPVRLLSQAPIGEEAASAWAQGGLAAAIGADDSPALHIADTLAAGDGLCDPAAVRRIIEAGPALIEELRRLGARFDAGLGLEAGHSRHRIVHAQGDASGREILRAVAEAVRRAGHVQIMEKCSATALIVTGGAVTGVQAIGPAGPFTLPASRVVIATGGIGGLFGHSTNPLGAIGQGLILAAQAGAELADLEFVQFHPTALDAGIFPMPLVSEAVRGEGAVLIDEAGTRFMAGQGRAELEPRDIVSRAVWRHMQAGHRIFLDARSCLGARFYSRFPAITGLCRAAGVDPAEQPIPIRPAVHYHMGGIAVDARGRSTVPGLWAVGEAACTGLHGANRLASNSLLEAAVTGRWAAADIAGTMAARLLPEAPVQPALLPDAAPVRPIMSRHAGVLRDAAGLGQAENSLRPLIRANNAASAPAMLALMLIKAMQLRHESRGGHFRTDFPAKVAQPAENPSNTRGNRLTWHGTLAEMNGEETITGRRVPA